MKLSNPEFSNVRNHAKKCKHHIKYEDFKIVGRAFNNHHLTILESLCIKQMVPQLNAQTTSSPLYLSWVSSYVTKTSEATQSFPSLLTGTLCACSPPLISFYIFTIYIFTVVRIFAFISLPSFLFFIFFILALTFYFFTVLLYVTNLLFYFILLNLFYSNFIWVWF